MSLNTKKYWLDGIFDDEEFVVPKEDLKPQVEVKNLSLTSPVVEKEIIAKLSWKEEILCRNFIYCDNAFCGKRHYYRRRYETRMWERDFAKKYAYSPEFVKNETRETLNRVIIRLAGDGVRAIVR
jgi:hypothetical protein